MSHFDVAVVGAGVAGLAAAAALRRAGLSMVVLERGMRIGGRAWTQSEPELGDVAIDHGASWLHAAERNPLVPIAEAAGARLLDSDRLRHWQTMIGDRAATEAELAVGDASEKRLVAALQGRLVAGGADVSLAAALDDVLANPADQPLDPWAASFEHWEGPVIAAAPADRLSLTDWARNRLGGANLMVAGGLGHFVVAALGPPAGPVTLQAEVRQVTWDGPDIQIETSGGSITAGGCIVTVSTGVLAAEAIRFVPRLPDRLSAAIAGLPMGLLTKIALRATGPDRLGLPDWSAADRRLERRGEPAMAFTFWPAGQDYATGFLGGQPAWDLAGRPAEAAAFAREELVRLLGSRAAPAFAGGGAVVSGWGTDPCFLGAYCYALPGQVTARATLGSFGATGRLVFAGEAVHEDLAGTVGGAYESGVRAARWLAGGQGKSARPF